MIVNIYIYQSIKGPRAKAGAYTYILETVIGGKAATLSKIGILEPMTENKAELTVLLEAFRRIKKSCEIRLIGVNGYIRLGIEKWLPKWVENAWENAKGQPVANAELWQQAYEYLEKYETKVIEAENSYLEWMIRETEKRASQNATPIE